MPDIYKATFAIKYGDGGFSFSHYQSENGYDNVEVKALRLIEAYLECCGTGVICPYIRISKEGLKGDSQVVSKRIGSIAAGAVDDTLEKQVKVAFPSTPDFQNTAVLLRLAASPEMRFFQYMRGVPDDLVILPGGKALNLNWDNAIKKYFKELDASVWGGMGIPKGPGSRKKIKRFDVVAGVDLEIQTEAAHGFLVNQKVRVGGVKPGTAGINGEFVVDVVNAPDKVILRDTKTIPAPNPNPGGAEIWNAEKTFAPYLLKFCAVRKITGRKAGRPFGVLAGRRSIR